MDDFNRLKRQVLDLTGVLETQTENQKVIHETVSKLQTENIKLKAEMKILRDEHSELLHTVYSQNKPSKMQDIDQNQNN